MSVVQFFRDGGIVMFPVLIFGLASVAVGARYAWRPEDRFLAVLRAMSAATAFATLAALAAALAATAYAVSSVPEFAESPNWHNFLLLGLGESLANAILGFGLLAMAWLLAAAGLRRAEP